MLLLFLKNTHNSTSGTTKIKQKAVVYKHKPKGQYLPAVICFQKRVHSIISWLMWLIVRVNIYQLFVCEWFSLYTVSLIDPVSEGSEITPEMFEL